MVGLGLVAVGLAGVTLGLAVPTGEALGVADDFGEEATGVAGRPYAHAPTTTRASSATSARARLTHRACTWRIKWCGIGLARVPAVAQGQRSQRERRRRRVEKFVREKIEPGSVQRAFTRFASWSAEVFGSHWAFAFAVLLVLVWLATGPLFAWSDTWQLYANTATTVITYLMVFIIQNTQNRDAKAMHLKLDELLRATPQARDEFMEAEEEDLEEILREKQIVDRDDPAPPKSGAVARRGNGKERRAG